MAKKKEPDIVDVYKAMENFQEKDFIVAREDDVVEQLAASHYNGDRVAARNLVWDLEFRPCYAIQRFKFSPLGFEYLIIPVNNIADATKLRDRIAERKESSKRMAEDPRFSDR